MRKFSLTLLWQKFRESNVITKVVTSKELISHGFFSVRENLSFFQSSHIQKSEKFQVTFMGEQLHHFKCHLGHLGIFDTEFYLVL